MQHAPACDPPTCNEQTFDGIICIGGEDWWYHNRGHFDFQIMRRLAKRYPVLFVNSLGVRMPSLSNKRVFTQRIGRKLKSLTRGVTHIENGFWVYSPLSIPGATGQQVSDWALAPQIKMAAARIGINKPLLWVHCPAGAPLVNTLQPVATVMQRTDRFEAFPEGDPVLLGRQIDQLKARADLVIYAAPHLMNEERHQVADQLLVTHGVDYDTFKAADTRGHESQPRQDDNLPADIAALDHLWVERHPGDPATHTAKSGPRRPRIGFIGGIDAHTFDPELLQNIAKQLPDYQFVLVGGSSLPEDWCTSPNVAQLGRKPYEQVPHYMAAMDVLIMPWNRSDWIAACNPIKLKEYLAVGRPVVTRDFKALEPWRHLVQVAESADEFASAITTAVTTPYDAKIARAAMETESWDAKADLVAAALDALTREKTRQANAAPIDTAA